MNSAPIVLVPGFWLGAWAWDEVAEDLRSAGHVVIPLTLPGLDSVDTDRSSITLGDHVDAIVAAVDAVGAPAVLAVHSGAAAPGYGATDRIPDKIAAMIYVDTAPPSGAIDPDFGDAEMPMPSAEDLASGENLDGLSEDQLAAFRRRAVPQPGTALREGPVLENDARLDVPSTVICTGLTAEQYQEYAKEGHVWMGGLNELRNLTYIDLPTSHWPMWSRPKDLAGLIAEIATSATAD